jgi:indolepyruvate ferredoxin oxidoreductase alpha subunit
MTRRVLLGDDAVGLGALHAGITGVYGYPGTPSTEIFEFIHRERTSESPDAPVSATWSANEKVAYEEAAGVSFAGRRALVTMKHVGLNVAADPFMNTGITGAKGGLVLAVADDPSMHSSQNEQDSRYYADFALVPCLEPADQQQAYEMTREAFDLSERVGLPVMLRLVTRLAHSRADVQVGEGRPQNPLAPSEDPRQWTLLPVNAREGYRRLLELQPALAAWSEESRWNVLHLGDRPAARRLGVITTGLAQNYFREWTDAHAEDAQPSSLHVGAYPVPKAKLRALVAHVDELLVIEEGYPFVERQLRGLLGVPDKIVRGRLDGALPRAGELTPDSVRRALDGGGQPEPAGALPGLPSRPPALCQGCGHADTFRALTAALAEHGGVSRTFSDIGCYTLGAYAPYHAIDTCLDMGASISMAAGAADAGLRPSLAVIGDSTFIHSGMTPLIGAAKRNAPITVLILDNGTVGMTGQQDTMATGESLERVVRGLGVAPEHLRVVRPHPKEHDAMVQLLKEEVAYEGTSVVIARRPCIHAMKK